MIEFNFQNKKYRAFVRTSYKDWDKSIKSVVSNKYPFHGSGEPTPPTPTEYDWVAKSWNHNVTGAGVWHEGNNVYYSIGSDEFVLNKNTGEWDNKIWTGLPSDFYGIYTWTDGDNIYYSNIDDPVRYILNKNTNTWTAWDVQRLSSGKIWTDDTSRKGILSFIKGAFNISNQSNVYYNYQRVLNRSTGEWDPITWQGLETFSGDCIWTDGENIYYSNGSNFQYVLNKTTHTWTRKTWYGYIPSDGSKIWSDGTNIYYSYGDTDQYILDPLTDTWNVKTWEGYNDIYADSDIWSDGTNVYCSYGDEAQYMLVPVD